MRGARHPATRLGRAPVRRGGREGVASNASSQESDGWRASQLSGRTTAQQLARKCWGAAVVQPGRRRRGRAPSSGCCSIASARVDRPASVRQCASPAVRSRTSMVLGEQVGSGSPVSLPAASRRADARAQGLLLRPVWPAAGRQQRGVAAARRRRPSEVVRLLSPRPRRASQAGRSAQEALEKGRTKARCRLLRRPELPGDEDCGRRCWAGCELARLGRATGVSVVRARGRVKPCPDLHPRPAHPTGL